MTKPKNGGSHHHAKDHGAEVDPQAAAPAVVSHAHPRGVSLVLKNAMRLATQRAALYTNVNITSPGAATASGVLFANCTTTVTGLVPSKPYIVQLLDSAGHVIGVGTPSTDYSDAGGNLSVAFNSVPVGTGYKARLIDKHYPSISFTGPAFAITATP